MISVNKRSARDLSTMLLLLLLVQLTLLAVPRVEASCVKVANDQELLEFSCEGGSISDLDQVPNAAEKIRLNHVHVDRLSEGLLARFAPTLIVFSCTYCDLVDVDDRAFRGMRNLQQLSLDNNRLRTVRAAWFDDLRMLTYLDLNYNEIEHVEPAVFERAPELVDLRLSGNRLACIDVTALSRLRDLKRIFLNENPSFGCPNAMRSFLEQRRIDFEPDAHWASLSRDRVYTGQPVPFVDDDRYPPEPRPSYWPSSEPITPPAIPTTTTTTTQLPPRRPYVPEMIQPSLPNQDFNFQTPYYAPKVPQQQIDRYRNELERAQNYTEQQRQSWNNITSSVLSNSTTPKILVAGYQPTTTECPNAACGFSEAVSIATIALGVVVATTNLWAW